MTEETPRSFQARDHLANERTFLSWIRTNLGIMAFGFVIEKFSFFIQQIAVFLRKSDITAQAPVQTGLLGYSSVFGIALVAIGALLCVLAFIKFKNTQKQIMVETYRPSNMLYILLTLFIFLVGILLIVYLIVSHSSLSH